MLKDATSRSEDFAKTNYVPLITFEKGERKEDVDLTFRKTGTKEQVPPSASRLPYDLRA